MSDEKFEKEELEQEVDVQETEIQEAEVIEGADDNTAEEVQGTVEEVIEEAVESAAEEIAEKVVVNDTVAESVNVAAEVFGKETDAPKANKTNAILIAVIAVLVIAAIAIVGVLVVRGTNKYNKLGYINISGRTLEDVANDAGMSVEDFKAEYSLPDDMKGSTTESAAYYSIPVSKMAEMNGITVDQLKEMLGLTDNAEITDTTPWGEAEGEATLKSYIGEVNLESFKEYYGLGEEITLDTKWKEVRNIVDQKALEEREAQEEAQKVAEEALADAPVEGEETPVAEEVPAEGEEAPAEAETETPAAE